ncbi:MAG: DUF362 domain-containing protein [Spirochaetia bacterium]|nr:DUF362 domain-containing protein [Spirochaetia bacterium]
MVKPRERTKNVYMQEGKPLVVKVPHFNGDYLPETVAQAAEMLGGVEKSIKPGDKVILKPNFNCRFAMPLSTHLTFLSSVIELLQDHGAKVTVAESSGKADGPTEEVVRDLKILPLLERYGVAFVDFEKDQWLEMEIPGKHFKKLRVPKSIYEADKRVYIANARGHNSARFSASQKLSVGWIDSEYRGFFHEERSLVEYKIPELNLGWQPDLVFIDARRTTISQSGRGAYIYPNVVLASGDMVAIDAEAMKIIKSFPADNLLDIPLEEMGQFAAATAYGLGSLDYTLLEAEGNLETLQKSRF